MLKAIQIDRYGGPDVFVRRDLLVPKPGPGEVLIRIAWSGINFMDIHTRQGKYAALRTYPQVMPTTLGIEGAGTVETLGEGVPDLALWGIASPTACPGQAMPSSPSWRPGALCPCRMPRATPMLRW